MERSRGGDLRVVGKTRRNEDVPLISPPTGRTGSGRDNVDPGLHLGADRLPRGLLEPADGLGRSAARPSFVALEPWR
eukprot:7319709-Alexandrium_andersonii.AAC.1